MQVELHHLDRKYERLKVRDRREEGRVFASMGSKGQSAAVVLVSGPDPVRPYVLLDGFKRVRAAERLGLDVVEAAVWPQGEADALVLLHSLQRQHGRNALEDGYLVEVLTTEHGMSLEQAAVRLCRSKSWASRRLGLVKDLPVWLQACVRDGWVQCYAATKYVVPLARANRDHAERLARKLSEMDVSTRDVGVLYLAWRNGDAAQQEMVVSRPDMVLAAHRARSGDDGPEAAVLDELAGAEARLHRARRGLDRLALAGLEEWCRDRLRRRWGRVAGVMCAVEKTLEEVLRETSGPGDATADLAAACQADGNPADSPPGEVLAACGRGSDQERQ
jgi:hypothetical protein